MKRKFDESYAPYIPLMMSVVRNCPLIQELEIMGMDYVTNVKPATEELFAIAQCLNLKRITLSNLNVKDG